MLQINKADNSRRFFTACSDSDAVLGEILSFLSLPDGWHYGSGYAPLQATVDSAISIVNMFRKFDFESLEVFPDSDGGILVAAYHGGVTIDVLCNPDGAFDFVFEMDEDEVDSKEDLPIEEIEQKTRESILKSWTSFDSFTPKISAGVRVGSSQLPSKIPQEAAYQLLTPPVSLNLESLSAIISFNSTPQAFPVIHRSFGDSGAKFFQRARD